MKKILILGISRTASKLFKEILNRNEDVVILHEVLFDFWYRTDMHSIFKKYGIYNSKDKLDQAFEEIYTKPYFKKLWIEYPEKNVLLETYKGMDKIDWTTALSTVIEKKARDLNRPVAGAKNPVHFSHTSKVLRELDEVKVLYLLRDPRAIYASEIPQKFRHDIPSAQFPIVRSRFLQRLLIFIHTNIEWIWALLIYRRVRKKVLLCKYEDLVSDSEMMMRRVFEYCDLSFSEQYLIDVPIINSSHVDKANQVEGNDVGFSSHGLKKWQNSLNSFERLWFGILVKIFRYKY